MNNSPRSNNQTNYFALIATSLIATAGCSQFADPWVDELSGLPPVTTPSVEGVRSPAREPVFRRRSHAAVELLPKQGSVTHGPLYFADPAIRFASDDGRFAWTNEDYAQFVVGSARFLWRIAMYPFNATETPPWALVRSDGNPASATP